MVADAKCGVSPSIGGSGRAGQSPGPRRPQQPVARYRSQSLRGYPLQYKLTSGAYWRRFQEYRSTPPRGRPYDGPRRGFLCRAISGVRLVKPLHGLSEVLVVQARLGLPGKTNQVSSPFTVVRPW